MLYTACRETGDIIERVETVDDGLKLIEKYEKEDGESVDFYDVVNENHESVL